MTAHFCGLNPLSSVQGLSCSCFQFARHPSLQEHLPERLRSGEETSELEILDETRPKSKGQKTHVKRTVTRTNLAIFSTLSEMRIVISAMDGSAVIYTITELRALKLLRGCLTGRFLCQKASLWSTSDRELAFPGSSRVKEWLSRANETTDLAA
jgi:hypothetical protein